MLAGSALTERVNVPIVDPETVSLMVPFTVTPVGVKAGEGVGVGAGSEMFVVGAVGTGVEPPPHADTKIARPTSARFTLPP